MRPVHLTHLRQAVKIAARVRNNRIVGFVEELRCSNQKMRLLIRDIVCDARFYRVLENTKFWIDYGQTAIAQFIDSLEEVYWNDEEALTSKKEDFLNFWFVRNLLPMTDEEKIKIEDEFRMNKPDNEKEQRDFYSSVIKPRDMTDGDGKPGDSLPDEIKGLVGTNPGLKDAGHQAEAEYLASIHPSIVELAMKIGRSGGQTEEVKGKFQSASRSDISGVTVGDNLNSLLPNELALLAAKQTESVFYHRYAQKRLQIFSSASRSFSQGDEKSGPIFICVDTSSSMMGEAEKIAKTLALAIAIVAQKKKRPVCMINYSHSISFFVLTDYWRQKQDFLNFLSHSYSGGNDENLLFNFLFDLLPHNPKYLRFKNSFRGADILIISDFIWEKVTEDSKLKIDRAISDGMNFYALRIRMFDGGDYNSQYYHEEDLAESIFENCSFFKSGEEFYNACDFRYVYKDGGIVKLNS